MLVSRRDVVGGAAAAGVAALSAGRAGAAAATRPMVSSIALEAGRVWMACRIGQSRPLLFIVDTGASHSMIRNDIAHELRMNNIGEGTHGGIGGIRNTPWYKAPDVLLGSGVRFPAMLFSGTQVRFGENAAGAFGAGLFTTYDSDLDFVKGEWRVYPAGRADRDGWMELPSRFEKSDAGQRIFARASVDGFFGDFLLDTGAPGEMLLGGRAAKRSGLWSDDRPYAPSESRGIGPDVVPTRLVRGERLRIGHLVFERPLVALSKPGSSWHEQDGLIGLSILRRLHLSTEVARGRIWAIPNGLADKPRRYPLSGLWLDRDGDRITLGDVGTGSPAAGAGLKPGDAVVGANWRATLVALNGPAGTRVPLTVERDGRRRDVVLVLADYL